LLRSVSAIAAMPPVSSPMTPFPDGRQRAVEVALGHRAQRGVELAQPRAHREPDRAERHDRRQRDSRPRLGEQSDDRPAGVHAQQNRSVNL
jgi:hypothetical protein